VGVDGETAIRADPPHTCPAINGPQPGIRIHLLRERRQRGQLRMSHLWRQILTGTAVVRSLPVGVVLRGGGDLTHLRERGRPMRREGGVGNTLGEADCDRRSFQRGHCLPGIEEGITVLWMGRRNEADTKLLICSEMTSRKRKRESHSFSQIAKITLQFSLYSPLFLLKPFLQFKIFLVLFL